MYCLTDIQIFNAAVGRFGDVSNAVTAVDGTDTTKYGTLAGQIYRIARNEELRANEWIFAIRRILLTQNTQALNDIGTWYAYYVPDDCLRLLDVYQTYPEFVTAFPFKDNRTVKIPYQTEGGVIFTDMNPVSTGPYAKYIQEPLLGGSTLSITTTNTSKLMSCATTSGLFKGMGVAGSGVGTGAKILDIASSTTFYVDVNSSASATITATLTMNWYDQLFCDALILNLANKLAVPITGNVLEPAIRESWEKEYIRKIYTAKQKNAIENYDSIEENGELFWTDRF